MISSAREKNDLLNPLLDPAVIEMAAPRPEEKKLSVQEVMDSLDAAHACPLTYQTPIIPFRIPGVPDSWELGALFYWIKGLGNRTNPKNRSPLFPSDFGRTVLPDRELIALINAELLKHGYTHADLLKECGLSPELYDYLINLNLSRRHNFFVRSFQVRYIRMLLFFTLLIGLIIYYIKAFDSLLCAQASKLDELMYQAVLKTFDIYSTTDSSGDSLITASSQICSILSRGKMAHDYGEISHTIFSKCTPSVLDTQLIPTYRVPPLTHSYQYYESQYSYSPLGDAKISIIPLTISCAVFSSIAIYHTLQRSLQMNSIKHILFATLLAGVMAGILLLGVEALISSMGIFQFLFQASAFGLSCATACNDGFLNRLILSNKTYDMRMPNPTPPLEGCQAVPTPKAAGAMLLAAPIAFFGGQLIQACRKRFFQNVEKQYQALEEKKFDYYSRPNVI